MSVHVSLLPRAIVRVARLIHVATLPTTPVVFEAATVFVACSVDEMTFAVFLARLHTNVTGSAESNSR